MTRSQGPSQGPSATASTSATRGQAAGTGLRGYYKKSRLPQTSLHGQDRQDTLKLFLRARQDLKTMTLGTWHGTPGRDVDWIHGTRVCGGRRAWVSGDPAGLSQRWSSGLESVAARRRDLPRTAGLGEPQTVAWSPANGGPGWAADGGVISREWWDWGSGNPGTREPAGGLGIATAGGGYLPRSAGMRARGQRTRLPWETKHRKQINTRKNEQNKTRWRGAAYG